MVWSRIEGEHLEEFAANIGHGLMLKSSSKFFGSEREFVGGPAWAGFLRIGFFS